MLSTLDPLQSELNYQTESLMSFLENDNPYNPDQTDYQPWQKKQICVNEYRFKVLLMIMIMEI